MASPGKGKRRIAATGSLRIAPAIDRGRIVEKPRKLVQNPCNTTWHASATIAP